MADSDDDIVDKGNIYVKIGESYGKIEDCDVDEEGSVEYLDLDMEVMDEVDEDNYFRRVDHTQDDIYIRQNSSSSPPSSSTSRQVFTVIQNSSSTEFETVKHTSQQFTNNGTTTKVLWSKNIPVLDNTKLCTLTNNTTSTNKNDNNSKTRRKRKLQNEENPDDNVLTDLHDKADPSQVQIHNGDSLDLFFQSMAQTVLQLPAQAQAAIKMKICEVISTAEIKYCSTTTTNSVVKKN